MWCTWSVSPSPEVAHALVTGVDLDSARARGVSERPTVVVGLPTLPELRRAAGIVPGREPTRVHVIRLNPFLAPLAALVDSAPNEPVAAAYPVFQILFPTASVVVDAAVTPDLVAEPHVHRDNLRLHPSRAASSPTHRGHS